jgi:hypothetical protein
MVVDVLVVLAVAAVLGAVAGFLWPRLVDPVTVTRTANGLVRDETALSEQFDALGWFTVVSAAGGLLLGAVMLAWRRTDEVLTLGAVLAGAFLAAWLCVEVGLAVGPEDPTVALAHAAVGDTARAAVTLGAEPKGDDPAKPAEVVYWVWPLFAMAGAVLFLLSPLAERPIEATLATDPVAPEAVGPDDVSGTPEGTPPSRQ